MPTSTRSFDEIHFEIERENTFSLDFIVLTALAATIATFGLLLNSVAVVIGAMIIAPLMTPIIGISFSGLIYQADLLRQCVLMTLIGVVVALVVSFVIASLFSSVGITAEILARTKPNIMDFFVALAAGFLGGYVKIRRPLSGAIPGVAIAISLMPPLCVVGAGIALGQLTVAIGAALLFATNFVCIVLAGLTVFLLIDFRFIQKNLKAILWPFVSSLVLAVPLLFNFFTMTEEIKLRHEVEEILKSSTYTFNSVGISKIDVDMFQSPVAVTISVNTTRFDITDKQVHLVKNYLAKKTGKPINLTVNLSPVLQITDLEPKNLKK